jgi:hypothetical protein
MKYFLHLTILALVLGCTLASKRKVGISNDDAPNSNYLIGTGIWDITGPAGDVGMMGYAQMVSNNFIFILSKIFITYDLPLRPSVLMEDLIDFLCVDTQASLCSSHGKHVLFPMTLLTQVRRRPERDI